MRKQTVRIVTPTEDEQHLVWIVSDDYPRLVDPRPLPASRFGNGHFWMFDHGTSDPDEPYTCGLCFEVKWKSYDKPCAKGRTPEDLNAERDQWIADSLLDKEPVWEVRDGLRQAQWPTSWRTLQGATK
ncbi:hypothetical protein ABZ916_39720 [Streptomyces sp. NPDC046853]|uniref:hypothetical protein n=1 Tax=Streptomyces sp. NPDC046853 TaxID=3154920 RepID=UPI0033C88FE6